MTVDADGLAEEIASLHETLGDLAAAGMVQITTEDGETRTCGAVDRAIYDINDYGTRLVVVLNDEISDEGEERYGLLSVMEGQQGLTSPRVEYVTGGEFESSKTVTRIVTQDDEDIRP